MSEARGRRLLFVAPQPFAAGELLHGLHVADEATRGGHRVTFVAPAAVGPLLDGVTFESWLWDAPMAGLLDGVRTAVQAERFDAIVWVDLAQLLQLLQSGRDTHAQHALAESFGVPMVALDLWSLDRSAGLVPGRLLPVPFAAPGAPGAYDALPVAARLTPAERDQVRRQMGLGPAERMVLLASSPFQHAAFWSAAGAAPGGASPLPLATDPGDAVRSTEHVPDLLGRYLARLGPAVTVVHVGPAPYPELARHLGPRYRFGARMPRPVFLRLLGAADLLLSLNITASTVASAVALEVPVLLVTSAYGGPAAKVLGRLPGMPTPELREWIERAAPLHPFRLWPLGSPFARSLFRDNPYNTAYDNVELLHGDEVAETCRRLLWDAPAAEALRARQRAYCEQVRALPSALTVLDRLLDGHG